MQSQERQRGRHRRAGLRNLLWLTLLGLALNTLDPQTLLARAQTQEKPTGADAAGEDGILTEEETKRVADNPVLVLQVPAGKKGEPGGLPNFQKE